VFFFQKNDPYHGFPRFTGKTADFLQSIKIQKQFFLGWAREECSFFKKMITITVPQVSLGKQLISCNQEKSRSSFSWGGRGRGVLFSKK